MAGRGEADQLAANSHAGPFACSTLIWFGRGGATSRLVPFQTGPSPATLRDVGGPSRGQDGSSVPATPGHCGLLANTGPLFAEDWADQWTANSYARPSACSTFDRHRRVERRRARGHVIDGATQRGGGRSYHEAPALPRRASHPARGTLKILVTSESSPGVPAAATMCWRLGGNRWAPEDVAKQPSWMAQEPSRRPPSPRTFPA